MSTINRNLEYKIVEKKDLTDNDSRKTYVVPVGRIWEVLYARIEFDADATVGNRFIELLFLTTGADEIYSAKSPIAQAASTDYNYNFGQGVASSTSVFDGSQAEVALPSNLLLRAGDSIWVQDGKQISGAGDDMHIYLRIKETRDASNVVT